VSDLLILAEAFALLLGKTLESFRSNARDPLVVDEEQGDLRVGMQIQGALRELLELLLPVIQFPGLLEAGLLLLSEPLTGEHGLTSQVPLRFRGSP